MRASTVLAYMADEMRKHARDGITLAPCDTQQLVDVLDEVIGHIRDLEGEGEARDPDLRHSANVIVFPRMGRR